MSDSKRVNPLIYALVAWFGSAPWLGSYSAWVEMSIFTQHLPEGWTLASVLIVTIQISSIGPLIFLLLDRCLRIPIRHGPIIQLSLFVCLICYIPIFLAWSKTIQLFGSEHSITLIGCIFILGMISIGSDIIWLPYMSHFGDQYLPAYFVGASISGLLPSALSLAQGSSTYTCLPNPKTRGLEPSFEEPRFSVSTFYVILFVWIFGSNVSFYLLNNHFKRLASFGDLLFRRRSQESDVELVDKEAELVGEDAQAGFQMANAKVKATHGSGTKEMTRGQDLFLLVCIGVGAGQLNTLLSSVQSYASLPYSQQTYFWAMILATICQPVAAFLAGIVPVRSLSKIAVLLVLCSTGTVMTTVIAFQSPNPWLKDSIWGSIISVFFQVVGYCIGCFLRTTMIETFRDGRPGDDSRLFWAGLSAQIGSLIGTLIVFPSINVFNLFEAAPQC